MFDFGVIDVRFRSFEFGMSGFGLYEMQHLRCWISGCWIFGCSISGLWVSWCFILEQAYGFPSLVFRCLQFLNVKCLRVEFLEVGFHAAPIAFALTSD